MNRINQLFNSNKKDLLSIYFVQVIQLWTVLPM